MRKIVFFLLGILASIHSSAETDYQLWQAYVQQARVSNKAGYWVDINFRTRNHFADNFNTMLFRVGGTYFVKDNVRLTAGYVYAMHFSSLEDQSFYKQEHRPWLNIQYVQNVSRYKFQTALRLEERFIQKSKGAKILEGYESRTRVRLSAGISVQLNKKKLPIGNILFVLNEEAMINAHSTDNAKIFDQNRAFCGFGFQIAEPFQLQLGYMHLYLATTKGYDHVHAIRVNFIHNLDFRKKK